MILGVAYEDTYIPIEIKGEIWCGLGSEGVFFLIIRGRTINIYSNVVFGFSLKKGKTLGVGEEIYEVAGRGSGMGAYRKDRASEEWATV